MEISNPINRGEVLYSSQFHYTTKNFILIALFLILCTGLSGCVSIADPESSQVYIADPVGVLNGQTSLGQSFVSRRPNLDGFTVWISRIPSVPNQPSAQNPEYLTVNLFRTPIDVQPLYTTMVAVPATGSKLPISIKFPNQQNTAGQTFYLLLNNASGTIQVKGRNEDTYPQGQAFVNNAPIKADLAFQLTYDYGLSALMGDIHSAFPWIWLVVPLLVVLWLPGWLLLEISCLRLRFDFGEQTALAIGLSLALVPVLMLWTTVLKIKWTYEGVLFAAGLLTVLFLTRLVYLAISARKRKSKTPPSQPGEKTTLTGTNFTASHANFITLLVIFLATLASRLIMVRDLATPAWVDSVHHTLITRLIMENGSYLSTYKPYLDFTSTAYHPGFHSLAAAFTWLSQLDLSRSLLVLGQVLNALAVFPVYLFIKSFTRSQAAGLFGALITGFLTPMPAYYTSWGRYTELTGLLLLPVVLTLIQVWMDVNSRKSRTWILLLGSLTAAGLFLIHYRVLVFMVCLVLVYILIYLVRNKDIPSPKAVQLLVLIISIAVLGITLVLPWFIPTFTTTLIPKVTASITGDQPFFKDFSWPYLLSAYGRQSLVLAGLGMVWAITRRKRFSLMLTLWALLLFFVANLSSLRLPGGGLISNGSVEIMLFFPISLLGGYFISELLVLWKSLLPTRLAIPALLGIFILFAYGTFQAARQLIPILNPVTLLSRQADLSAIEWIKENIPPGETVVINPFAWGYGLYAGNDGGYWISPLTDHFTLPPPVLYGLTQDVLQINQQVQQVIATSADPPAFWKFLRSNHLSYVYCGTRGGVISPQKLVDSNLFIVLYHQDGVWIFNTKP